MITDKNQEHLRKAILAITPVHEKALKEILNMGIQEEYAQYDFFCKAGDYSLYMAYIYQGIFRSFYSDTKGSENCTGFYGKFMFMLPLPAFIYRKPVFQSFQALQSSQIIKIKYAEIENLARQQSSVNDFLHTLIYREWIVRKELTLAAKYIYNVQTRFQLFADQFEEQIAQIPPEYISSYLNIPEKKILKMLDKELNKS